MTVKAKERIDHEMEREQIRSFLKAEEVELGGKRNRKKKKRMEKCNGQHNGMKRRKNKRGKKMAPE